MTQEILKMSKEELISNILEVDKRGREMESLLARMQVVYEVSAGQIVIPDDVQEDIAIMERLALVKAEMNKVLLDKYGCFIM